MPLTEGILILHLNDIIEKSKYCAPELEQNLWRELGTLISTVAHPQKMPPQLDSWQLAVVSIYTNKTEEEILAMQTKQE